jgi:voltage-gated potassium channel
MIEIEKEKLSFLNLLIIILSFYILGSLVVDIFFTLPKEIGKVLSYVDNVICIVFLIDFIIRFRKAESKLKFMKWGWIDLLASIPMIDYLRFGRILRLIRLLRVIRAYRSINHIIKHVFKSKVQGTLTSVSIIAVLVLLFSSLAILHFEKDPNSNIKTAEDAIWWAYVTITTVGYGDKFPVTTEGRIIATILMTVGVGLFGTFTAFVSSWFVKTNEKDEE